MHYQPDLSSKEAPPKFSLYSDQLRHSSKRETTEAGWITAGYCMKSGIKCLVLLRTDHTFRQKQNKQLRKKISWSVHVQWSPSQKVFSTTVCYPVFSLSLNVHFSINPDRTKKSFLCHPPQVKSLLLLPLGFLGRISYKEQIIFSAKLEKYKLQSSEIHYNKKLK